MDIFIRFTSHRWMMNCIFLPCVCQRTNAPPYKAYAVLGTDHHILTSFSVWLNQQLIFQENQSVASYVSSPRLFLQTAASKQFMCVSLQGNWKNCVHKSSNFAPLLIVQPITQHAILPQTWIHNVPSILFACFGIVLDYSCLDFGLDPVLQFGLVCWFWIELIELVWCQSTLDSCLTQSLT